MMSDDRIAFGYMTERMYDAVTVFHELAGEKAPLSAMRVFLLTASLQVGVSTDTLAEQLDMSLSGVSRVLASLGRVNRTGEPGMGLIEGVRDLDDPRRTKYFLTDKGRDTMTALLAALTGKSKDRIPPFWSTTAKEYQDNWRPVPREKRPRKG